jgi:hypothetical protein
VPQLSFDGSVGSPRRPAPPWKFFTALGKELSFLIARAA